MKVDVNFQVCESNGLCAGAAPQVFDLDDDDTLHLLRSTVTPDIEEQVRDAVRQCPRRAIVLAE
ncbi:ferredoxin [Gordonia sp. HNM0687]|uniref:Ferredoxin n=1 Tax=Gordonia mangrovi TaxID=2665643 RepID=A0A6L7GTG6_9ACTN|nr:ferredoxin [Gordonia mangrovi]MXP23309.1 ferredoxin [Gordonia mangrovi]UVF76776.1 ferredoxin [Gordonia mangrovi]